MATIRTKFIVGLFVTSGIVLTIVAIVWLGMSHYLEKGHYQVAYFNESVQGLDKDSPVKYRGVTIGRVESIGVAPDANLIQVILKIESPLIPGDYLEDMVAQLKSVGITGIMYVELERKKPDEKDLSPKRSFPSRYPVVATKPSEVRRFLDELEKVLRNVSAIDLKGISDRLKQSLDKMNVSLVRLDSMMRADDFQRLMASFENAANSITRLATRADGTVQRLDHAITTNEEELATIIQDLQASMKNASDFLGEGVGLIKNQDEKLSRVQQHLLMTLKNLERASENLNRFSEMVADQPSQLLFGQPPPPRKVD